MGRLRRRLRLSILRRTVEAWDWQLEERRYLRAVLRNWLGVIRTAQAQRQEQGLRAWKLAFASRLGGSFQSWRELAVQLGIRRRLVVRALKRWYTRAAAAAMERWKEYVQARRITRRIVQRVALKGLHAAWGAWIERAGEQQRQRCVCAKVVARWERGAAWRGFGHWAAVTLEKKQERVAVGRFRRRLRLSILRRTVEVWEWWHVEQSHLSIVFQGWLITVRSAAAKRQKQGISAWKMAISSRVGGSFQCWRALSVENAILKRLTQRALARLVHTRLWRCLHSWQERVQQNLRMRSIFKRAVGRLRCHAVTVAWDGWLGWAEKQKRARVAVGRCRRRLRRSTQRRTIEVWVHWVQDRLYIGLVFQGWADAVQAALGLRREQGLRAWKMAISSRVGGSFQCWRALSVENAILKRLTQRALARLVHTRLWRCLHSWQERVQQNLRMRSIFKRAVGRLRCHAVTVAWDGWLGWAEKQKRARVAVGRCRRRLRRSTQRRTIEVWVHWVQDRLYIGLVFQGWADAVQAALGLRREQGLRAWKMAVCSRVGGAFRSWQYLATELATRKIVIRRSLARLVERRLWQHYHAWSSSASVSTRRRKIMEKAISKLRYRTRSSAWAAWVERVQEQKRLQNVCAMAVARWKRGAVWRKFEIWADMAVQGKRARVAVGRCRRRLKLAALRRSAEAWVVLAQRRARERAVLGRCRRRLQKMLRSSVLEHWQARLRACRIARRAISVATRRCVCEFWWLWVDVVRKLRRQGRVVAKIVERWRRAMVWKAFSSWVLWLKNNRLSEEVAERTFEKLWSESIAAEKRRLKIEKLFYVSQERSVHWFKLAFLRQWVRATENMQVFRGLFSSWWIFSRREAYREEQLRRKVGLWRMEKVLGWWLSWADEGNRKKIFLRRASRKWRCSLLWSAWRSWMVCMHARTANAERSVRLLRILALKNRRFRAGAAFHRWCLHVHEKQRDIFRLRRAISVIWHSRLRYTLQSWAMLNLRRRVLRNQMKNLFAARSLKWAKIYFGQWRSLWVAATWDAERLMSRAFSSWLRVLWSANKERNLKLRYSLFAKSNEDKLEAVTQMMKCIKLSLIEMISELRSDLRKSSQEIQRLAVAEYSKQWQVTIAKEKHQVKHFVACKLEENAAILMCDVLEQAETCMKTMEGHISLSMKQFSYRDMGGAQPVADFEESRTVKGIQTPPPGLRESGIVRASQGDRSGDGAAMESDFSLLRRELLVRRCFERWRSKPSQDVFLLAFLEIRRARASFQQLSRAQLRELQSMPKPPKVVRLALEALCTMLNGWSHTNWDGIRRSLQSEKFSLTVLRYSGKNLTEDLIQFLEQKYLSLPELSEENAAKASRACAPLVNLIVSHVRFKKLSLRFSTGNS